MFLFGLSSSCAVVMLNFPHEKSITFYLILSEVSQKANLKAFFKQKNDVTFLSVLFLFVQ